MLLCRYFVTDISLPVIAYQYFVTGNSLPITLSIHIYRCLRTDISFPILLSNTSLPEMLTDISLQILVSRFIVTDTSLPVIAYSNFLYRHFFTVASILILLFRCLFLISLPNCLHIFLYQYLFTILLLYRIF